MTLFKFDLPSTFHFQPCVSYEQLDEKYKRSFNYCKHHVHCLSYKPSSYTFLCKEFCSLLKQNIRNQDIILYKGGLFEKSICDNLNIKSYNIELWGVPKIKNINEFDYIPSCGMHIKKTEHCSRVEVYVFNLYIKKYCKEKLELLKKGILPVPLT